MARAVVAENLSKRYLIGHQRSADDGLRHRVEGVMRAPWRWAKSLGDKGLTASASESAGGGRRRGTVEELWALKDLSFEIQQGELVGIIGRNGAGKSTLLKILSRITEPTTGRIRIAGRVSSLLEVGTGFHQELTGRENIFLNGAILGMTKAEITRNFDEIVAFSEIEKFLDTPVKRYSSGMYVRLAFAVAAHLEPEILIVDEVLAVGDAAFQKKCLGKMGDVATQGRTILFVSHDMNNITKLCTRGILLNAGRVESDGDMASVIADYIGDPAMEEGYADLRTRVDRSGRGDAQFESVELIGDGERRSTFAMGDALTFRVIVRVTKPFGAGQLAVSIVTNDGIPVHCFQSVNERVAWPTVEGRQVFEISVPRLRIAPGSYAVDLWIGDPQTKRVDYLKPALGFHVIQTPSSGLGYQMKRTDALVAEPSIWSTRVLDTE